ncbi:MAG: Spo0E family sporulation regulatory protein-aspartic acid phosphatase [Firmicutes bacterium]|nr:Spo0E family sporulation regulatory protein-aspartic acid phosphatase [Bacillota bacterium]
MEDYSLRENVSIVNECLKKEIEKVRKKLNNLVIKKNMLDSEVIRLSEYLDELIVQYKKVHKEDCFIKLSDVSGIHSTFYYYGKNHLFPNMIKYINYGINNNEMIYISMRPDLYNELLENLISFKIPSDHIKFSSVKELISSHKIGGIDGLKKKIRFLSEEVLNKGYNGIRWIGEPTYAIEETSKDDFLNWEVDLTESLKNTKASIICIYDFYDYMREKKVIDKQVVDESYNTHSHVLNKFNLKKSDN